MKRVAILQSNYIPWKGYFDLINLVDEFIIYDDVQYTRRDWRNRNQIKSPQGTFWLTIPVNVKGKYEQKICEIIVHDLTWASKHWKSIELNYAKADYFSEIAPHLKKCYEKCKSEKYLSIINYKFISLICRLLDIKTKISWSSDYGWREGRTERLLYLCQQVNADEYLSGPAAKSYLDEQIFSEQGISVRWMDYSGYLEYPQKFPPFVHTVSIIDLLLNQGIVGTKKYMLSFNNAKRDSQL